MKTIEVIQHQNKNNSFSVVAIETKTLVKIAKASFATSNARENYKSAMEYVEYLVSNGFDAIISCNGEELDRYLCVDNKTEEALELA